MRYCLALLAALLCACAPHAGQREQLPGSTVYGPVDYQPPELLVRFRPEVSERRAERLIAGQGAQVLGRNLLGGRLYSVLLPPGASVEAAAARFAELPEVLYAEPSYRRRPQDRPAVSEHPEQGTKTHE